MKENTIKNYTSKTKQFAIKEFTRIIKLNETDFLYQLAGLYGRTLGISYNIKNK